MDSLTSSKVVPCRFDYLLGTAICPFLYARVPEGLADRQAVVPWSNSGMPVRRRLIKCKRAVLRLFVLTAVILLSKLAGAQTSGRPNIVLLMGDDHGWEETGYNGHPHVQTPVLDQMAASGLRFDRFYAAHPSCSPTRGSVLTGRHPNRYGTFAPNWSLRPEEATIAQLLAKAGYVTGHFGKWHVGPVKADSPTNPGALGFDEWLSHDNFFELDPTLSRNGGAPIEFTGEGSAILVEEAVRFMERAVDEDNPFFVVVWFASPHEPYSSLAADLARYDDLPENYAQREVTLTSLETGLPVERSLREVLRERYAEITSMDRSIGRLRDYLAKAGLKDDTLVWYKGDNGTPSSGVAEMPHRGWKGSMYEGGIRVPGVIEWPTRIRAGRITDVPAVTSDILPTLAALVGLPLPARPLDGIDLTPVIEGMMVARPSPIFFWSFDLVGYVERAGKPYIALDLQEGTTPLVKLMDGIPTRVFQNFHHLASDLRDRSGPRVVIDNDYKLVISGSTGSGVELFNLRDDPAETRNLAGSNPDIPAALEPLLAAWQESVLKSLGGADYP